MEFQPDGPSSNAWGIDLCDPVMISHQNRLVLLARARGTATEALFFRVLDPKDAAQGDDFSAWNGWYRYRFPEAAAAVMPQNADEAAETPDRELRLAGMDLLTVPPTAKTVAVADAAFRVMSDGPYLSVFRVSTAGTLLLSRLALIGFKEEVDGESVDRYLLEPAWEVRFRRSGVRDVPLDDMDGQSYTDPVGEPFYEPTHEFPKITAISGSAYAVARVPTADPSVNVIYSAIATATGVQLYQVRQSGTTVVDLVDTPTVYPPIIPTLKTGGTAIPPIADLAPALVYYAEQENSTTNADQGVELQRAGHLMLAIPVTGTGLTAALAVYDFSLDRAGNIAVLPSAAQSLVLVDGSIANGNFVPDTTSPTYPTAANLSSTIQMVNGLLVSSMVLGQIQPRKSPNLYTGDDGLVHAYFGGPLPVPPFDRWSSLDPNQPQAMVAQFDARANRLVLTVPWATTVPEEQPNSGVDFVALQSGCAMQGATVAVSNGSLVNGGAAAPDLCTVTITYPAVTGLPSETWKAVPRELSAFMNVLNGQASDDSADPAVLAGEKIFYDFSGTLAQARVGLSYPAGTEVSPPPAATWISTRPDLALSSVQVTANGTNQDYVLTFKTPGGQTITVNWRGVPPSVAVLRDVFDGLAAPSTYAYPTDTSGTPLFALNTDAPGVDAPVLLYSKGTNPNAGGLTIAVSTSATVPGAVDVVVTSGGTPTTIPSIPAPVATFVSTLQANATFQSFGLGISGSTAGGNVRPTATPAGRLGLVGTCSLFDLLLPSSDLSIASIPNATYAAGTQGHTFNPTGTYDVTRMIGFLARSLAPSSGELAFVQNAAGSQVKARRSRSLHAVGGNDPLVSGVWRRTTPQVQCALTSAQAVSVPVAGNGAPLPNSLNLRPQWDWTMEAWFRPESGVQQRILTFADTQTVVPSGNPELKYAVAIEGQEVVTGVSYQKTPGSPDSSYFQTGTSVAASLMPASEFTWELWIQPDNPPGPTGSGSPPPLGGIIQLGQSGRNPFLIVGLDAQRLVRIVTIDNNSNQTVSTSSEPVPAVDDQGQPTWSHLALVGVQNSTSQTWTLDLYLDGSSIGHFVNIGLQDQPAAFLVIGGNTPNNSTLFGNMAQLRCWSLARSIADIRRTWLTSLSGYEPGLLGNWPLTAIETGVNGRFVRNTAAITNTDWDAIIYQFRQSLTVTQDSFFLSALATVGGLATVEADALLANGRWNHLAIRYEAGGALDLNPPARYATGRIDWVNCGHSDNLGPAADFAIDAYVQVPSTSQGLIGTIMGRWATADNEDDQCFLYWIDGDGEMNLNLAMVVDDEGTVEVQNAKSTGAALRDGVTHHVGVVFSSRSIKGTDASVEWTISFYKDGVLVGSSSETIDGISAVDVRTSQNDVTIGTAFGPIDGAEPMASEDFYPLRARLGAVRYWSTDADVKLLFPENYPRVPQAGRPKGLAAQWLFREQAGRVAFDQIGGNDAKLSSSALWSSLAATSKMSFVANGALVGTVLPAATPLVAATQSQFAMGCPIALPGVSGLVGSFAQLCLYDQLRTIETIQDQMYVPRQGNETGLIAAWNFSQGGVDITGGQNNASPPIPSTQLQPSTAPISDEGPYVRNVYGGLVTDLSQSAPGPIAVGSYADAQDVGSVRQRGVLKRQYVVDPNQTLARAIQIGELDLTYIGQVQTDPTLIGYIEGAPPVPSENLTRPYYLDPGNPSYMKYLDTSKVTLQQEASQSLVFSTSSAHATQIQAGAAFGLMGVKNYTDLAINAGPVSMITNSYDMKGVAQLVVQGSGSVGGGSGQTLQANYGATQRDAMGYSGDWEGFQANPANYLNPTVGRRFVPDNLGYALVESLTADLYAIAFGPTKAALGTMIIPNPAIPPDRNILLFPMRNDYTKAGTLDGKIGLVNDPSFPMADAVRGSYFKPTEAYGWASAIEYQRERALGVYEQFDSAARAQGWNEDLEDAEASQSQDFSEAPSDPVAVATPIQGLVNRYVWTADGGIHVEEENTSAASSRSYMGAVSRGGGGGFHAQGEFFLKLGFAWSFDVMATHKVDLTVSQETSNAQGLSMSVSADGEAFLRAYDPNATPEYGTGKGAFLPGAAPGKVKVYRFMTIYMPPSSRNSKDFDGIVDPVWKRLSNDPNARAMRELDNSSPTWRVVHRVTYVERVPPPIASRPLFTSGNRDRVPVNVEGNAELIRLVAAQIPSTTTARTRLIVGNAVALALNPPPQSPGVYPASALERIVPWWLTFLNTARPNAQGTIPNAEAAALLQTLVRRITTYIYDGYATGALDAVLGT